MCRSDEAKATAQHVVIVGAGPASLLLANLLLKRNKDMGRLLYKVTLVESRDDLGKLSVDELRKTHRSWMVGLAGHGFEALRTIPALYDNYVSQSHAGVRLESVSIVLGSKEIKTRIRSDDGSEGYVVDRNFCVAALAKYLNDTSEQDAALTCRYNTNLQYVDREKRQVLVRSTESGEEDYLPYDLLVGADGSRSVVQTALVQENYDFEMDFANIFNNFRAVHVKRPPKLDPNGMVLLPNCLPLMTGIALPMPDDIFNISTGCPRHHF